VRDEDVVDRMTKIVRHDWKHSHVLDLTDEGLLAELERHKIDSGDELALDCPPKKKRKG
jgi:cardiolipin synthase A/B